MTDTAVLFIDGTVDEEVSGSVATWMNHTPVPRSDPWHPLYTDTIRALMTRTVDDAIDRLTSHERDDAKA